MAIQPIPSNRSSDLLAQARLLSQLQSDTIGIQRLQTQLSTGFRYQLPSEDAPSALRAQGLQRLLELKSQIKNNIAVGRSFMDATDNAVSGVADILSDARSLAVSSTGSTAGPEERGAAVAELDRMLKTLMDAGNKQFRGRYLFSGSRVNSTPFSEIDQYVAYHGNAGELRSYVDTDSLLETNIDGDHTFGAISSQRAGTVDLDPVLSYDTRLVDLRGGRGLSKGSVSVSDGSRSVTVDLSGAETIGDVAELLSAGAPLGRTLTARVGPHGLILSLDAAGGGNLSVAEVGGGTVATELGIKSNIAIGTGPLNGGDINAVLKPTTRLADILGVRASAVLASLGTDNDIFISAKSRGATDNGAVVQYVDDATQHASAALIPGNEAVTHRSSASAATAAITLSGLNNNLLLTGNVTGTSLNNVAINIESGGVLGDDAIVNYDSVNKVLTLQVDSSGSTEIQTLIDRINSEGTFTAAYDATDPVDGGFSASALVSASDIGVVRSNTSNSGGAANTYFVAVRRDGTTANDVVRALQNHAGFSSRFEVSIDGFDTSLEALSGFGYIDLDATAVTSGGAGADLDTASGLLIRNGIRDYEIDISGASTVEDMLNILNGSGANVEAEINEAGTGINIRSRLSGADLSIGENGGITASQLGLRTLTTETSLSDLNYGRGVTKLGGTDFTIQRGDGVDLAINLASAETIGDVLDLINNAPGNSNPSTRVLARLIAVGNGIELVGQTSGATRPLAIESAFGASAAKDLGLIPQGATSATGVVAGSEISIQGTDRNPVEVAGAFTALIRLRNSLANYSLPDIERATALLDDAFERVLSSRGEIGARGRTLELLDTRLQDEEIELKSNLSDERDADFAESVTALQARQAAYQATLQLTGQLFKLTLLDFL